ncbi:MAG: T9SS type A sorting domain-containing protein [Melioribacteraceae bacterium]|nr:T9SS type A sorting domain-containing protein [Melioribacteraceae bacterium]
MKKLKCFVVCILFTSCVFASGLHALEFRIHVDGNTLGYKVEATAELVSACWDAQLADTNYHPITTSYQGSTVYTTSTSLVQIGWNMSWNFGQLALGKYKITVRTIDNGNEIWNDFFYFDYRTSDLPESYKSQCDIDVYWNPSGGQLYWDSGYTVGITSNTYELWTERSTYISHKTTYLEPFKPVNFDANDNGSYPQITWSHSPQVDWLTAYEIHRQVGRFGFFSKIADVGAGTTSYIDYDYVTGQSVKLTYKIRAKNGSIVSDFTPEDFIYGDLYKEGTDEISYEFNLDQNYPNPFNPITLINYSIPSTAQVVLKVYDITGKEMVTLVDEKKEAGNYSVNFNGENLSSGVYIYSIVSGEYSDSKKLILMK